jgi:hypothetical protein
LPLAFVTLPALPVTPSGKIDRRALPAPDGDRSRATVAYEAPRSDVEKQLAEMWARILKLKSIGLRDNFFDLGGHSLLATQLMSRVRDVFTLEVPVRRLFEAPTLLEFSELIETMVWANGAAAAAVVGEGELFEVGEV